MKWALLIVGIIGMALSFCVAGGSYGFHLTHRPAISLTEAMWGIVPGSFCCSLFFIVAVVGLILVLMAPSDKKPGKKGRLNDDDDDLDDE